MTALKAVMAEYLKGTGNMDAFIEGRKCCTYNDIVYAQDDNGCIYFYSRSGNPTYCGFSGGWTPESGNSARYVPDSYDDTLNLCIATDQTTYVGCVDELIAYVDASQQAPIRFSVDMVGGESTSVAQGLSVTPITPVLSVEARRDRVLEIKQLLVDLKAESVKLVSEIEEAGFYLKLEVKDFTVGCLVELVSIKHSNTNMDLGQRCRVASASEDADGFITTDEGFYVNKRDLIVI